MSLRRIAVLLGKEVVRGPRNFMFIFAIVIPVVFTLLITLLFGTLFSGRAKLGVVDAGHSQIAQRAEATDGIIYRTYATTAALRDAVARGGVDLGLVLPADFDTQLAAGNVTQIDVFVWGESQLKNRALLATALAAWLRDMSGDESPVTVNTAVLGNAELLPWEQRLMPFIVLVTILLGGIMVPATSLVDEKQKRTLTALTITAASYGEVFVAKGLLGILLSTVMAVLILLMNRAFGAQPWLLLLVLLMGAVLAATFGVLLGMLMKDVNALFTTLKAMGILLYAPAIVYMFPRIPQWIGRVFPTYYIIQPVIDITQNGASLADVAPELGVLLLLIVGLMVAVAALIRQAQLRPARFS